MAFVYYSFALAFVVVGGGSAARRLGGSAAVRPRDGAATREPSARLRRPEYATRASRAHRSGERTRERA